MFVFNSDTWHMAPVSLAYSNALFLNTTTRIAWSQADLSLFGNSCTFYIHVSLSAPCSQQAGAAGGRPEEEGGSRAREDSDLTESGGLGSSHIW